MPGASATDPELVPPPTGGRGGRGPLGSIAGLLLLFLAGALLRLPTLELPLEGDAARLATRAHVLAGGEAEAEDWAGAEHRLEAWLAAPLTRVLPTPTLAWRVVTLLLGALGAPLLFLLARRLGAGPRLALAAGLLFAVHPAGLYGTVEAGTSALGGVFLLGGAAALGSPRRGPRRLGAVLVALLPLAYAFATPAAVLLVALATWRERSTPWRLGFALLLLAAVLMTPLPYPPLDAPSLGRRLLALLGPWLLVSTLVLLVPGLLASVRRLLVGRRGADPGLAVAVAGGAFLLVFATLLLDGGRGYRFAEAGLAAALPAVPLVLLAGLAGRARTGASGRRGLAVAGLLATVASLGVVSAPVQTTLWPDAPLLAGRLAPLSAALRRAAAEAGEGGWVSLDAPDLDPATAFRLQDLAPGRGFVVPTPDAAELPLPEDVLLEVKTLVVVSRRPTWPTVTTLDGRGIFRAEVLGRYGPWVVVRVALT